MAHMPMSIWLLLLLSVLLLANTGRKLWKNIRIARATGLRYVVAPYYSYNRITALFVARYILRNVEKIWPNPVFSSWRFLVRSGRPWKYPYAPFAQLKTDTFLLVAPGGIIFHTADADVISQITARDKDFPKASWLYTSVSIYGQNILSSDGAAWRHHRKLTAPAFTEKNNHLVWSETLEQSQAMLAEWSGGKVVDRVAHDAMQLSLNVINCAGFGRKTPWSISSDENTTTTSDLPPGHTMTFMGSLKYLLENILTIMILPSWFLQHYPNSRLNKSYRAYAEWGQYMREMIQARKDALLNSKSEVSSTSTTDLVSQLVKAQDIDYEGRQLALTDGEVRGNLFVFMIAGHETSANSIHFSLLFLALHPHVQRRVQADLDTIFAGRKVNEWDYDRDIPLLQNSFLAAVLDEQLRLIPPAINIPKMTHTPQTLTIGEKEVTLPAKMMIRLCVQSVHQNPKFWSHETLSTVREEYPGWTQDNDLDQFKPDRWLNTAEPEAGLLVPPKGAYIPFSDGARACLGKRFAQVEVLAALAVILTTHSVELAVEQGDEEVENMDAEERARVWKEAAEQTRWKLKNKLLSIITVQMMGEGVKLRAVPRGREIFAD